MTYASSTVGVTISLLGGAGTGGLAAGDVLTNVENLIGSNLGDVLSGNTGANTIDGGAGDDQISGGTGDDSLFGNTNGDTLDGGLGSDTLDGGDGNDTADYRNSDARVTVDLRLVGAQVSLGHASGDRLINIENVTGSSFNDTLTGDDRNNVLMGSDGDDLLVGLGGADTLDGGAGVDRVDYSSAGTGVTVWLDGSVSTGDIAAGDRLFNIENVIGSAYDDVIGASSSADVIDGGNGQDTVSYANATSAVTVDLTLTTQVGAGWANGDRFTSIENVTGSNHNDLLRGDSGNNVLSGGGGDDTLIGGLGEDTLIGGAGIDTASYQNAVSRVMINLAGNAGLEGEANNDYFSGIERWLGSSYDDVFYMSAGATYVDGSGGWDVVSYVYSSSGIVVDLRLGTTAQSGGTGWSVDDTLVSIEAIEGSGYNDLIIGTGANEWFWSRGGDDTLIGGGGDDWLEGAHGNDSIDGGEGYDTWDLHSWSLTTDDQTLYVDGRPGTGTGMGAGDVAVNIERISGGRGNETVIVGGSLNSFDGKGGIDTVDFGESIAGVTVDLNQVGTAQVSAGLASNFILSDVENVRGTQFADTLIGDGGDNVIVARGGADSLLGNGGKDTFFIDASQCVGGGANLVRVDGGSGSDSIQLVGLTANQTVDFTYLRSQSSDGSGQTVATSIEQIGIRDGLSQTINISAADIQALVGQGNASTLTLRVDFGDAVNAVLSDSQIVSSSAGGITFFADASRSVQIAQISYLTS